MLDKCCHSQHCFPSPPLLLSLAEPLLNHSGTPPEPLQLHRSLHAGLAQVLVKQLWAAINKSINSHINIETGRKRERESQLTAEKGVVDEACKKKKKLNIYAGQTLFRNWVQFIVHNLFVSLAHIHSLHSFATNLCHSSCHCFFAMPHPPMGPLVGSTIHIYYGYSFQFPNQFCN